MTKSYYYIPTHFLYSPLLFFLLIFMHQLTYCHTLPKPFSQKFFYLEFMHQPYTALTLNSTRPATGLHTFPRQSSHHKPIHQQPQIPHPYSPTNTRRHRYTRPYCPPDTHTTQPRPPTLTLTPTHSTLTRRQATPYPDVDAASAPFRTSAIGQARHQQATP